MVRKLIWILLGLGLSGLIGLSLYFVCPMLCPPITVLAPLVPDCDLRRGPCTSTLPSGGKVQFEILPRDIPILQSLNLTVRIDGLAVRSVMIDFAGTDMNMGYNRVLLEASDSGVWVGQATLPVCVRSRMTWEAKVLITAGDALMAAPFRFDTVTQADEK